MDSDLVGAVAGLIAENKRLKMEIERYKDTYMDSQKFYNVQMSVAEVANLHGVCKAIVRKYISLGLIETHPQSSAKKMTVRGSDALMLDFKELKKQAKIDRL